MKKLFALLMALMLMLASAMGCTAEAEDAQDAPSMEDAAYRANLARNAQGLMAIVAASTVEDFVGAPDAQTAWNALSLYVKENAEDGQFFTDAQMASCYADLFGEGEFHEIAGDYEGSCFERVEGGYSFIMADGEPIKEVIINSFDAYTEDKLLCDVSVYALSHSDFPQYFSGNYTATLVPSETSPFGAQVVEWAQGELPEFPIAESDAQLYNQEGNSYGAMNAIDGKFNTCWAYPLAKTKDPALTLLAEEPQQVRGLVLTPGYAKSAYAFSSNRRVAQLKVTVGDTEFQFDLEDVDKDFFDGTYVLSFGGVLEADSIVIEVTDTYKGAKFDDVCVSEVLVF